MKNIMLFIIGLIIMLVEVFFTNFISSFISVNFLLIYIIFISLYIDKNNALILCALLGLISDLMSGGIVGVSTILFLATSYFISIIEKSIFKDKRGIVCLLVAIVSVFYSIISAVFSAIFFVPTPIIIALIKCIVAIPAANTLVAFFGYTIFEERLKKLREE
ncbi:MAG: hypothetical protein PEPC_01870 [Peptostreptococcus russellii]|uniref:Rod shape-determining protein MreD n=1 Tax=Peptostreptococcus russellii TaxID=215200 RepID=A0A2P7Q0D9_9FIRM|nr:rod shape-determining protein MreD [Peptostreptococcus russellii]PSJ31407.1 rod shape-determining protein MreD [Peptostreptococcus russellii]